jgi:branched-chain amino acid transport system substrate-binding protein
MSFKRNVFVLALVVFLLLGLFSGMVSAEEKIIKIGTVFPLTGPCALAGARCKAAVETAAEIINNIHPECDVPLANQSGILDGYKIVLVHTDHQGKPDVGKTETERLFNQEKVYAIIGSYNSSVTKPASFVAEIQKKLFMCGASSSAALTERDFKYFFRFAPTDKTESIGFVETLTWLNEAKNAGIKTIGLIYENSEFGKHAADEGKMAAEAAGFEIIANVAGGDYALWVRTMKQMNWLPKIALNYCSGYQDPMTTQQLGDDANYFMGGTGYSPEFAELMPAVAAVEEIYKAKTDPSVPFDSDSIQEAVALFILAQAIEKAGTLDIETVRNLGYRNSSRGSLC